MIYTNTPRLSHHRKMILELLLSAHCRDCTTCRKNGVCTLQNLAKQLGVSYIRFENNKPQLPLDESSDCIVRDPNKCILCGDCVRTCEEIQGLGILDFAYRGSKMQVMPAFNKDLAETDCVGCGQCRAVCPTGAITIKQNIHPVWKLLADRNVRVVAQIAPAVRIAVGDKLAYSKRRKFTGASWWLALRRMGFDEIYDTNFGADLTVMEESKEFLERLESGLNLPLFTSCCLSGRNSVTIVIRSFATIFPPAASPQQMFGALIKEEARMNEADPRKTVVISIAALYSEKSRNSASGTFTEGEQDVDYVLTTTQITRMIKEAGIDQAQAFRSSGHAVWSFFRRQRDFWRDRRGNRGGSLRRW